MVKCTAMSWWTPLYPLKSYSLQWDPKKRSYGCPKIVGSACAHRTTRAGVALSLPAAGDEFLPPKVQKYPKSMFFAVELRLFGRATRMGIEIFG